MNVRPLVGGVAALACLLLLGSLRCSYVSDGGDEPVPRYLTVSIDDHDPAVTTDSVWLQGEVDCENCPPATWAYGTCPDRSCPTTSSISMSWHNETTGASGAAPHGYWGDCHCSIITGYCYTVCRHGWSATVPLMPGPNAIRIRAIDTDGATGEASTVVERLPPP